MDYETILVERRGNHDGIVWLTLNRPEKLNAISMQMFAELEHQFKELRNDRSARVLVITGAGRGFCAGVDFSGPAQNQQEEDKKKEPEAPPPIDMEGFRLGFRRETEAYMAFKRLEIPTIAAVNGVCVGGGLDLVSHCDMAVGSTAARYQVAYIKRGVFPDLGGFQSLPRILGWRKAMELMTTGRFMSAEEAHESGLTNYLVEPDAFEDKTMDLALEVEAGPPIAQKLGKMLAYRAKDMDFESAMEFSGAVLAITQVSQDYREGIASFMEKREPEFKGV